MKPNLKPNLKLILPLLILCLGLAGSYYAHTLGINITQLGDIVSTKIPMDPVHESSMSPLGETLSKAPTTTSAQTAPAIVEAIKPATTQPAQLGVADATGGVFYGRKTANNAIGMYVNNNVDDIKEAAKLVNSNGGKWGYVLLTMEINDRNKSNWQDLMDAAKSSSLIPIVQLFNNNNCNPDKLDFKGLAETLNSVKWPTKHRYITVFNEMNAKDYWCQRLAPAEYAKSLDKAINAFKAKSAEFFIMPGAFNSSARTQDRYMGEDSYLIEMNKAVPGIFKKIDGWSTHSYPQPNFSGDPNNLPAGYGARDTINNYIWEMNIIKNNFGVFGLPIFITETGWLHKEGQNGCNQYSQNSLLSADATSSRFKDAFLNYWLADKRIVAITPFIFKSSDPCAKGFAWQNADGGWYPQAQMLLNMKKTSGTP